MNNLWELENDLNAGSFTYSAQNIDSFKLEAAIKILTSEIKLLQTDKLTLESEVISLRTDLVNISANYKEMLSIIRKIGKDYPEVVIANTHLLVEEETNE